MGEAEGVVVKLKITVDVETQSGAHQQLVCEILDRCDRTEVSLLTSGDNVVGFRECEEVGELGLIGGRLLGRARAAEVRRCKMAQAMIAEGSPVEPDAGSTARPFSDEWFAFMGEFREASTETLVSEARARGANAEEMIYQATTVLVLGSGRGPEFDANLAKCEARGIRVISENEYIAMLDATEERGCAKLKPDVPLAERVFADEWFAVTGSLAPLSWEEALQKVRARGGSFMERVTSKTTILVAGHGGARSKLARAQSVGARTISVDEFIAMLDANPLAESQPS